MKHYDTLGIEPDASADEVKRAFRSKASAAHPDKGGDGEEMAAINAAYAVLADPARRQRYDETGDDAAEKTVEAEARDALLSIFSVVLDGDDTDILAVVRRLVAQHRAGLLEHQRNAQAKRARLVRRTGKVRIKKGDNLAQMLIDQKLAQLDGGLKMMERGIAVNDAVAKLLGEYEQDEEQAHLPQYAAAQQSPFNPFAGTQTIWTPR